jgi:hypothetical protein
MCVHIAACTKGGKQKSTCQNFIAQVLWIFLIEFSFFLPICVALLDSTRILIFCVICELDHYEQIALSTVESLCFVHHQWTVPVPTGATEDSFFGFVIGRVHDGSGGGSGRGGDVCACVGGWWVGWLLAER